MVTDVMLREAAGEAENAILASLSLRTVELHQFSSQFQKKIDKLVRRAKHPIRYQFMRSAAAILLLVAILFGMVFAISPEVRAGVINWVRRTFEIYQQYTPGETTPIEIRYEYVLSGIDEKLLIQEIERENGKVFLYRGEGNSMIKFSYTYGAENNEVFVESDGYTIGNIMIGNIVAEIYTTQEDGKNNIIVWKDEEGNAILHISAHTDQDALIELAESVQRKD